MLVGYNIQYAFYPVLYGLWDDKCVDLDLIYLIHENLLRIVIIWCKMYLFDSSNMCCLCGRGGKGSACYAADIGRCHIETSILELCALISKWHLLIHVTVHSIASRIENVASDPAPWKWWKECVCNRWSIYSYNLYLIVIYCMIRLFQALQYKVIDVRWIEIMNQWRYYEMSQAFSGRHVFFEYFDWNS